MNGIVFKGFKVIESSFKLNEKRAEGKYTVAPRFECKLTGDEKGFDALFSVSVSSLSDVQPAPFDLKISVRGLFEDERANEKEERMRYAIRTLFPFLRAHAATLTASCGAPPFLLPDIDLDDMLRADGHGEATELN